MSYLEVLRWSVPEAIIALAVFVVLAADLLFLRGLELRMRLTIGAMLSCFGCAAAIGWMLAAPGHGALAEGILVVSPTSQLVKIALLALTIFAILLSIQPGFTPHAGEYFALLLLAAVGMMFLVSSDDLLVIFTALELTSLSLYVLTAFDKRSAQSADAALKYFLFGGMSAAFTLFGFSLLYGLTGSTNLGQIAAVLQSAKLGSVLVLAMVMTVVGFGFKVAAAPFHLWAPDAYYGAPVPVAAFIASGSKVAGFFVLARVMLSGLNGAQGSAAWQYYSTGWVPMLAILAALSMLLGNLAALVQRSVRRLLAYSAIAHAGYMLLAILAPGGQSFAALLYYVISYAVTTLGAFGVIAIVQSETGADGLAAFTGLSRRAPALSFCMLIFMLSLAGIPPLAGFFGKFYVFAAALTSPAPPLGLLWLVALALGTSAVALYYYLQVLKCIYVADCAPFSAPIRTPALNQAILAFLALGVLAFGCAPQWLLTQLTRALNVP